VHDKDNTYARGYPENGTAFTSFLYTLNGGSGFAGANSWRLPTLAELQTILLDFPCTATSCACPAAPCVDPALDASATQSGRYWSATSKLRLPPFSAWLVYFDNALVLADLESTALYLRAVRGGL
jgi:hypothetical protein